MKETKENLEDFKTDTAVETNKENVKSKDLLSIGELIIGTKIDPTVPEEDEVRHIKMLFANLINRLYVVASDPQTHPLTAMIHQTAITKCLETQMAIVKAITFEVTE